MKISYRITPETYVEAQKLHAAKGAPISQRILKFVFPPFFLLIGAITAVWGSFGPNSWGMLVLGTFWAVLFWVYPPWQWKRTYAKVRRLHEVYWLWSVGPTERLNKKARVLLADGQHELYLSVASTWEISIKAALGKLHMP